MSLTVENQISSVGRILVVDDEERMCLSLKSLLERNNYRIDFTTSAGEALNMLARKGYDIVITDIKMPDEDGISLLRKAKEIDPYVVVILMTGFASLETAKAAINRGAFDYLTKPLELEELLKSINKGLASRQAEIEKQNLMKLISKSNEMLEERVNQLHALYRSAGIISETIDINILLQQIINLVAGVVGGKAGSIMLLDERKMFLRISATVGWEPNFDEIKDIRIGLNEGIAGYVAAKRESVIIDDIAADSRFKKANRDKYETTSAISAPVIHRDELLGVINLNNKEGRQKFTIDDLRLLETFASNAAIAIVNARLFEGNKRKLKELTILHRIAMRLSSSRSESEVFSSLFEGIRSLVEADFCYFFSLRNDDTLEVIFSDIPNESIRNWSDFNEIAIPSPPADGKGKTDRIKWITDYLEKFFEGKNEGWMSDFLAVPVSVENTLSGFFCIGNGRGVKYSESAKRLVSIIASQTASLYERQKSIINGSKLLTMGKMISELTHDLKKPLTNLKGSLQILESKWKEPGSQEKILGSAIQEVNRLAELVKEMLNFADPRKYERTPKNIITIIGRVLSLLDTDIRKHNIVVVKEFSSGLPNILINETEVFEALINIFFNAIESMPNGGELKTTVRRHIPKNFKNPFLEISISDQGYGIPADKIHHIFERYYTTKDGGTGLGLALVKRVMDSHNGSIEVESELGKGTTFYLNFPISK